MHVYPQKEKQGGIYFKVRFTHTCYLQVVNENVVKNREEGTPESTFQ